MSTNKSDTIVTNYKLLGYILLGGLSFLFIIYSSIWGMWITISLILAIWTKDKDQSFLLAILILMIFGPVGRFLSPGTIVGSLWAFDFLIGFGLMFRIKRFWPIGHGRDASTRISMISLPMYFVIFSIIGLIGSSFVFPLIVVLKGALYTVRWLAYCLVIRGIEGKEEKEEKDRKQNIILIVASVLATLGFLQLWLLPSISQNLVHQFAFDSHVGRLFATWFDPNFLGGFLVVALLLSLGEKPFDLVRSRSPLVAQGKGLKGMLIGIIGVAILLTFSRSSYLALVMGILVYFGFKSPKLIGILVAIVLAITSFVTPVRQRVVGAISLDITARQRLESWSEAWQIIKVNPVVGVGYNLYGQAREEVGFRYKNFNMPYNPAQAGADSSLLTIWATAGIGGLLVYLLLFWKIWRFGSVAKKSAILALFVHSLFVNSLLLPPMMIVFWLIFEMNAQIVKSRK